MVFGPHPARLAILGPGGYGKTTLANAVLAHCSVRQRFGEARYFVACESATTSGDLLIELAKGLGLLEEAGSAAPWPYIMASLTAQEKECIICLDNFESPWNQATEIRNSVEELLSKITSLHCVTVLVTMRGTERPAGTHWTQPALDPLKSLDDRAAQVAWQRISTNFDDFAEKLIAAVDDIRSQTQGYFKFVEEMYKVAMGNAQITQLSQAIVLGIEKNIFSLPKGLSERVKLSKTPKVVDDAKENKPASKTSKTAKTKTKTKTKTILDKKNKKNTKTIPKPATEPGSRTKTVTSKSAITKPVSGRKAPSSKTSTAKAVSSTKADKKQVPTTKSTKPAGKSPTTRADSAVKKTYAGKKPKKKKVKSSTSKENTKKAATGVSSTSKASKSKAASTKKAGSKAASTSRATKSAKRT